MKVIPLQGGAVNAHQQQFVTLGDSVLQFDIRYITRDPHPGWSCDISRDGEVLIHGAMLVANGELTKSHDLDIGRIVMVGEEVTLNNLGVDNKLVWIDE